MEQYPYGLNDFARALEATGRHCKVSRTGLTTQCVHHQEKNPSMEVFPDGWAVCYASGERFHISHYFPELRDPAWKPGQAAPQAKITKMPTPAPIGTQENEKVAKIYRQYDLYPEWEKMDLIPRDHQFKGLPLETLDELGWRWTDGVAGMGAGYFIPYFNGDRTAIPFAQVRHLSGSRRFTFLPEAEMTAYGKWNLYPGEKVFVVEGPSDAAVLTACMVPAVAIPSASCHAMLQNLARYCLQYGIELVYAGDNDEAGEKLRESIDDVIPYRRCQPPLPHKDWGDYIVAEGIGKTAAKLLREYQVKQMEPMLALVNEEFPKPAYVPPSKR